MKLATTLCALAYATSTSSRLRGYTQKNMQPALDGAVGLFGNCTSEGNGVDNMDLGVQYRCSGKRYAPPSTYINGNADATATSSVYDLAIIGSGAQAAYLVSQLRERMGNKAKDLKIGVFEAGAETGGRLMSAYGPGALGNAVQSPPKTEELPTPPEYGGMRVDPYNHPLVWDAIEKVARQHGKTCNRSGPKAPVHFSNPLTTELYKEHQGTSELGRQGEGCTDPKTGYMTRMYTADIRYYTGGSTEHFGAYLKSGRVAAGASGAVEDNCLSLIALGQAYMQQNATAEARKTEIKASTMIDDMCANCATLSQKTNSGNAFTDLSACEICGRLPSPGKNLISCIGYDDLPSVVASVGIGEGGAITGRADYNCKASLGSTDKCSYLYMFKEGSQKWVQDMMYEQGAAPQVGVAFQKKLTALDWEGGDTAALSAAQASAALSGDVPVDWNRGSGGSGGISGSPTLDSPVKLTFADGSVVRAKTAYLTTLPADLEQIGGFEPWAPSNKKAFLNFGADKMFMSWEGGLPEAIVNATRNTESGAPGQIRLVLDGDRTADPETSWITRQVWYWDANTILVYGTAVSDPTLPANQLQNLIQTKGMTAATTKVVGELSEAFFGKGADGKPASSFPMPTWARVKGWSSGSLSYYNSDIKQSGLVYASYMSRPLGANAPVFYGSSEASGSGGNGWIQGSLEFAYHHLPTLTRLLDPQAQA